MDADQGGTESVADLVESGQVTHIPIPSFEVFADEVVGPLLPKLNSDDTVIVDTLSALANTTRGDFRLGTAVDDNLWAKRALYFGGDKNFLTQYEAAEKMIMRRLKNVRSTGAHIITITHEDEQVDAISQTKKRAPGLNQAFYGSLMAHSTDVFRLSMLFDDIKNADGSVKYKRGTRVLYLQPVEGIDGHVTKYHVPRSVAEKLPSGLIDPDWQKLYDTLEKDPGWLVLYGPPGIGKTTLACSKALLNTKKDKKAK